MARPKPDQHIMLLCTVQLARDDFWQRLGNDIGSSPQRDAFVFVHGYNVSFETAALRTAQLATDLSFKGAPIMFSWPSKEGSRNILMTKARSSGADAFKTVHRDICIESKATSIHLIAHSMGSRALIEVIQALSTSALPRNTLKQLIFAAPDVDSGVFQQAANALGGICAALRYMPRTMTRL